MKAQQLAQRVVGNDLNALPELLQEISTTSKPSLKLFNTVKQCIHYVQSLSNPKLNSWIKSQETAWGTICLAYMVYPEPRLAHVAFETLLDLVKVTSERANEFQQKLYIQLVATLLETGQTSWMSVIASHYDLTFYFYKSVALVLKQKQDISVKVLYGFLSAVKPVTNPNFVAGSLKGLNDEKNSALDLPSNLKRHYSDCWLVFLMLPLGSKLHLTILESLHSDILPNLSEPTLLMDYLVDAYNTGGLVSLLALNGVFTLMHEHNLDYPDFYQKLYGLLDADVMHSKHFSRFFRLVDLFLSSTHLPSYVVASFLKKMSRLSLAAPPCAIIVILPLMFNLLKKHSQVIQMIHVSEMSSDPVSDPFEPEQTNLEKTRALESCLWEILSLQNHYMPTVSSLAKIFEGSLARPLYDLNLFFDQSYDLMLDAEMARHAKKLTNVEAIPLASQFIGDQMWSGSCFVLEA